MAQTVVVKASGLKKSFTLGKNVIEILHGIDFEIHSGDYVIFYGPSGCGKSTLLNVCSGLESPTEGKLLVRDQEISKLKPDEMAKFRQTKIGIVFQSFNLLKSMTVQENVALPLVAAGQPRLRAMNRAGNLLHTLGLSKHLNNIPTELSGGQQQRVAIARALTTNPWILICDEPTGNLDSKSSAEVMDIIYSINRKSKRTILMVTHNPDHRKYATKVMYVQDGKIVKTEVNKSRPALKEVSDFSLNEKSLEQS